MQKKIGIVYKILADLSDPSQINNPVDTHKPDGNTPISSFGAVTSAVFNMQKEPYNLLYSHMNDYGGVFYSDYSQMTMVSILCSNTRNYNKKINIKPIGTLCFKDALKEVKC